MPSISDFIYSAYDIKLDKIEQEYASNEWVTTKLKDDNETCIEDKYDKSFRDSAKRVEKKYKEMKTPYSFIDYFESLTLEKSNNDLKKYIEDPNRRVPILGTTEFLFPFVANCILNANDPNKKSLPFIVYAPLEWSNDDNINTVDCFGKGIKCGLYHKIIILLPLDQSTIVTKDNIPRITIFEIYRLYLVLGDFDVKVEKDKEKYTLTIYSETGGGGNKKYRKKRLSVKKRTNKKRLSVKKRKNLTKYRKIHK
jgi:hypothetical protein